MNVELFSSDLRWILLGVAVCCGLLAGFLRLRQSRIAILLAAIAVTAAALLLVDRAAWLTVEAAAPPMPESDVGESTRGFNEYRWVLLAPWGPVAMGLGMLALIVIVGLSWHTSARFATPWRRAAIVGLRAGAAATALILFLEPAVELRQVVQTVRAVASERARSSTPRPTHSTPGATSITWISTASPTPCSSPPRLPRPHRSRPARAR